MIETQEARIIKLETDETHEQRVVVVDVNMKFGTMVTFLVKLAIAAIPATLILAIYGMIIFLVLGAIFGGFSGRG